MGSLYERSHIFPYSSWESPVSLKGKCITQPFSTKFILSSLFSLLAHLCALDFFLEALVILTRSSHSGSRRVPRRPHLSFDLGKLPENPISVDPIDAVLLDTIPSYALVLFKCPASLSRSPVELKVTEVEAVWAGPSTVYPHS